MNQRICRLPTLHRILQPLHKPSQPTGITVPTATAEESPVNHVKAGDEIHRGELPPPATNCRGL